MATTTQPYTGNDNRGKGTEPYSDLSFSFDYLKTEDVKVSLNGTQLATTKYTFPTGDSIQFTALGSSPTSFETTTQESNGAPKTGVTILIHRRTDTDSAHAVYATGSSIRATDLNNNADQLLFFAQECSDTTNPLISDISGFSVEDTAKVDGSMVYYDSSTSRFKADATTTKSTIVDGGSF